MPEFAYDEEKIVELKRSVSEPRFSKYLQLVGNGSEEDAFWLYVLNAQLSGAFLLPLETLEVLLRNRCDEAIAGAYGADWITNGSLKMVAWQRREVENVRHVHGGSACAADFCLGFWVQFFGRHYSDLWRERMHAIFVNRPDKFRRQDVFRALDAARDFRNRIAHHEQVVGKTPADKLADIMAAVGWVSPTLAEWLAAHEQASVAWGEIQRLKAERGWTGF